MHLQETWRTDAQTDGRLTDRLWYEINIPFFLKKKAGIISLIGAFTVYYHDKHFVNQILDNSTVWLENTKFFFYKFQCEQRYLLACTYDQGVIPVALLTILTWPFIFYSQDTLRCNDWYCRSTSALDLHKAYQGLHCPYMPEAKGSDYADTFFIYWALNIKTEYGYLFICT